MTTYEMHLAPEPYAAVAAGTKIIESRIYDQKRQQIALGDHVIFINRDNKHEKVKVQVTGLLRAHTFEGLFKSHPPQDFGGPSEDWLLDQIAQYYPQSEELQYGVIGIEFVRI